jgi:hypothetical protein
VCGDGGGDEAGEVGFPGKIGFLLPELCLVARWYAWSLSPALLTRVCL